MHATEPNRHRRSVSSKSFRKPAQNASRFFAPASPPVPPPRSAPSTYRKPRRNVGDKVFVSSCSAVLLEFQDTNAKEVHQRLLDGESVAEVEEEENFEEKSKAIRTKKDVPKIRNKIFEESLESQEISFYIGKWLGVQRERKPTIVNKQS